MSEQIIEKDLTELETNYLAKIEELKQKMDAMIDPEEHAKLQEEHDKLLNDYINKRPTPKKEVIEYRKPAEIAGEMKHFVLRKQSIAWMPT